MGTRLYRSREDRMLAGVAGGLAEIWDADPSLIRILWAILVPLTGGIALVVYVVMAIVVPEEPYEAVAPPMSVGAADGSPGTPAGAAPPPVGAPAAPDWRQQRAAAREQRHAARAARRAERGGDGRTGSIVIGAILVLVGLAFLVRQYLPSFDFDYVWPFVLVALGALEIGRAHV